MERKSFSMRRSPAIGVALTLLSLLGFCALSPSARASVVGSDDASTAAYDDGWGNGDDGSSSGDAFNAWQLSSSSNGGFFVGSSTNISNPGANINSSEGTSLGMYGQGFAEAIRPFNGALSVGQAFELDLAVNFRNGNKGVDLRNSSNATIFNFNVGSDDYVVNGAATGNGSIGNAYSNNTAFHLTFIQVSGAGGTWKITRTGGVSDFDQGTYSGVASGFKLYVNGTDGGTPNDLMANNFFISVVPEAGSIAMVSIVGIAVGLASFGRRRWSSNGVNADGG